MMPLSDENLKKRPMDNGQCSTSFVRAKWKPRKVSAVRDFPAGCGASCLPANMTRLEAVAPFISTDDDKDKTGNSVLGIEIAAIDNGVEKMLVENNFVDGVQIAGTGDGVAENNGLGLVEEAKEGEIGVQIEGNDNGVVVEKEMMEELHEVEVDVGVLSNGEVSHGVKSLETNQEFNSERNIQLGIGSKGKFSRRRVSAVRDFPPFCGWNAPVPTEEERLKITGKSSLAVVEEVSDGNVRGGTVERSEMKEDVLESANMYKNKSQSSEIVTIKKSQSSEEIVTEPMTTLQANDEKKSEQAKGHAEKALQEMVVYSREKPLKRKPSNDTSLGGEKLEDLRDVKIEMCESEESVPESRNKSMIGIRKIDEDVSSQVDDNEGREIVVYSDGEPLNSKPTDYAGDLECETDDRVIVIGLMASANCPWRQGRQGNTKPNNVMSKSKVKRSASATPKKSKEIKVTDGGGKSGKKKSKSAGKVPYVGTLDVVVRNEENIVTNDEDQYDDDSPAAQEAREFGVNLPPFGPKSSSDARNKVRQALRLFQAVCRKLLQGEESKTSQGDESKPKQNRRIDLAAAKIVQEKGKEVNTGNKTLGPVPGVEVGDEFQYRVELALVGVHRLYQAGIDYVTYGDGKDKVAASIVASGGYDDELDNPDVLIYSGSGGTGVVGKGKVLEDQKLERGNLALKNSILYKNPVRVIRGSKETKAAESSDARGKLVATYVYDGLYTVERYWQDPGPKGTLVFKFELRRIPGQPELAWKEVRKSKKSKIREGLCVADISDGKEKIPICAVNTIDEEKPPEFNYINKMIYPSWYNPIPPAKGCDCTKQCYDKKCACASKNGGELPYNRNGAIVEIKPLVYECGPSCNCPPTCYNRVTQLGIKIPLEIFKTETRGWGVRSLSSISSGSFICEYIGELLEDIEAERRTGNDEYLFDIGQNYTDCSLKPDANATPSEPVEEGGFTIDAAKYGNVGRFVNHSCSPNLYAQNVLYDQEDQRMPHIMLFAAENIPKLQELTYHYNYAVDTVHDSNGNIKVKNCFCGSSECTGRMY